MWLLGASCFFYMYFIPEYILILILLIVVDYLAAIKIEKCVGRSRKIYLIASIVATSLMLFLFKYYQFAIQVVNDFRSFLGVAPTDSAFSHVGLLLPIGLSFHTFQSLSYVIEVFRGNQKAERNFGIYALYVMFFPQLVAGPIERPQNLLHQFRERHVFDTVKASSGLRLILWGLFQKTVVADRLGEIVDHVYKDIGGVTEEAVVIATAFFAFQIYADFQGYSNIARGCARLMGFELMKNFDRPYCSQSVTEFWRRWHISLSTWFRDYIYFPLKGSRKGKGRGFINIMITFLISGLWHGANWTYLVWGGLNGLLVSIEKFVLRRDRWPHSNSGIRVLYTTATFVLVTITWTFFRANSLTTAFDAIAMMPQGVLNLVIRLGSMNLFEPQFLSSIGTTSIEFVIAVSTIIGMEFAQRFEKSSDMGDCLKGVSGKIRWLVYMCFTAIVLLSWIYFPVPSKPFIYFQF